MLPIQKMLSIIPLDELEEEIHNKHDEALEPSVDVFFYYITPEGEKLYGNIWTSLFTKVMTFGFGREAAQIVVQSYLAQKGWIRVNEWMLEPSIVVACIAPTTEQKEVLTALINNSAKFKILFPAIMVPVKLSADMNTLQQLDCIYASKSEASVTPEELVEQLFDGAKGKLSKDQLAATCYLAAEFIEDNCCK